MRKLSYLLLLTLILQLTIAVPTIYAQSDGGDGVSGAGSDNASYDTSTPDTNNDSGGNEPQQGQNGAGAGTGEAQQGETGSPDGGQQAGGGQVTQDQVDQARSDQTTAWDNYQSLLNEGGHDAGEIGAALQSYLEASAYADTISGQYEAQMAAATAENEKQDSMQSTISGTGLNDIANGATVGEVAAQHLDPSLSPERAAQVMGEWTTAYANAHGLDALEVTRSPEFQAAWSGYVGSAVQAGTISPSQVSGAMAGGVSLAGLSTGATVAQVAENAAATGGLSAYAAVLNSLPGQVDQKTAAEMLANYGVGHGASVADIAAAQRNAGIDASTAHAAVQSAFAAAAEARGETTFAQGITQQFNNGFYSGAAPTAVANGIPTGGPAISAASVHQAQQAAVAAAQQQQQGQGSNPVAAVNTAISQSDKDADGKVTQAGLNNIVQTAINSGMDAKQLAETLREAERSGAVAGGITSSGIQAAASAYSGSSTFQGAGGTAQSYGAQAAGFFGNPNTYQGSNVTVTPGSTTAAPAQPAAPPDQNNTPLSANQFNQGVNKVGGTETVPDSLGVSLTTVDGKEVQVVVANPANQATGSTFGAGSGGHVKGIDGTDYSISPQAAGGLYQTIESGQRPSPQDLANATNTSSSKPFGGK